MFESKNPYSFETNKTSLRDTDAARVDQDKLERRLGLDAKHLPKALEDRLNDFTVNCHLAIGWYQAKLSRAIVARRWYFVLSIFMLALIPASLVAIAQWSNTHASTSITTQISAVVTGLLAFQRGVSAWLDKRQVVGGYSKASSDLKGVLYSFEQKWDGLAADPGKYGEFLLALRDATATCKDIVRKETDQYFQTLSYPTIDVGAILKSSSADAKDLTAQFVTPVLSRPTAATDLNKAKIAQLEQRVDDLDAQLVAARLNGNAAAVNSLTPLRDAALRDLRAAQVAAAPALAKSS